MSMLRPHAPIRYRRHAGSRRPGLTRGLARAVLVLLLLGLGLLLAPTASAHTELVSASPADGATLARPPSRVVLTFDEAVSEVGDAIVVTAPSGARVDDGPAQVRGARVDVALQRLTEVGEYTVAFRVVSDDGHPVTDTLTFTFNPASAASSPAPTATPMPTTSPAAGETTGSSGATPWIAVAAVAVIIVVVAWLLVRRRRA